MDEDSGLNRSTGEDSRLFHQRHVEMHELSSHACHNKPDKEHKTSGQIGYVMVMIVLDVYDDITSSKNRFISPDEVEKHTPGAVSQTLRLTLSWT